MLTVMFGLRRKPKRSSLERHVALQEKAIIQLHNKNAKLESALLNTQSKLAASEETLSATQDSADIAFNLLAHAEEQLQLAEDTKLEAERLFEDERKMWQRRLRLTVMEMLPVEDLSPAPKATPNQEVQMGQSGTKEDGTQTETVEADTEDTTADTEDTADDNDDDGGGDLVAA
jgi:hypothetical protein